MVFMEKQMRITQKWSPFSPIWNTNNLLTDIITKSNVDVINQEFKQLYKLNAIKYILEFLTSSPKICFPRGNDKFSPHLNQTVIKHFKS